MRLLYELQVYPKSLFVTLTFDNPSLEKYSDNPNKSLSLFLDRVRKKYGKQVRHWFVAEYGKKRGRLHYHGILFNISMTNNELESLWKYGNTFVGYANEVTAKYIVKYLTKDSTKGVKPPRVISSKGIGASWLETSECDILRKSLSTCRWKNGIPLPLPRYYIDKMYSKEEKEIISYYSYMESPLVYYLNGKEYTDEHLYKHERDIQYNILASHTSSKDYEHTPRISSALRFRVLTDYLYEQNIFENFKI